MDNFKFTVIKIINNDILSIEKSIESIINQSLDFKKNIQLILVDAGSSDGSYEIALDYQNKYPDNIKVLLNKTKLKGLGNHYNLGLNEASGDFILFFDNEGELSNNAFKQTSRYISKYSKEIDIITLPVDVYDKSKKKYVPKINYVKKDIVDVNSYINHSTISLGASFIKKESISDIKFNEELIDCEDTLFLTEILLKKNKFGLVHNAKFKKERVNFDYKRDSELLTKNFVIDKFKLFFNYLINISNGNVLKYIQYILANELNPIIWISDLNEIFDSNEEISMFWKDLFKILNVIDLDELEIHEELPRIVRSFLVYLKNDDFHIETKPELNKVFLKSNDYLINSLHFHLIRIDIVEVIGNTLNLSGSLSSNCNSKNLKVEVTREFANGKKEVFTGKYVEYPTTNRSLKTFLGVDWEFPYNFDLKIPLKNNEHSSLSFKLIYHENDEYIEMDNKLIFREFAGLSTIGNYLIKNGKIIYFRIKTFYIVPYSYKTLLKLEFKTIIRMLRLREPFLLQGIFYRWLYVILFPFWKNKKIWLFVDRDTFADDNAEHLFKYCIKQNDGIKKFFILNKDSPDFKRLNKEYDIVPFGSFKHKINYLFSEKIMISQVTRGILNPFTHENSWNYEGLTTYKFCFLQHGVTKDDISWWIKKFHKNLFMFLTVSDLERNSMINGYYNYEEDRIPALGFPRFDNLKNEPKKEILFIPTWRRDLDTPEEIINSNYLKNLNSFLNNEKLNKAAQEMDYTLVFRPHPELWKFLEYFNINHVRLSEEPYQEMFKTASLMITDYSSVAFDFAYLKKPVIYYQDGNYHYGEGYFDYETMGFGKVIFDEDELVDAVIDYMKKDCKMETEYINRVESFFKFNDKNNCKRVYEWLLNH